MGQALTKDLLDILVCPESKQPVKLADETVVSALNEHILTSKVKNVSGGVVLEKVEDLLIREDGKIGYAVRSGIPIMLVEEGIELSSLSRG